MNYLYRTYKGPLYCLLYKSRFLYPAWWAECAYCLQGTISSISHQTTCSQSSQAGFQIKPKHQQSLAHFSHKWLAIFGPRLTRSPSKHTPLPLKGERHSSKSPLAVKASFLSHWSSSHLDHSHLPFTCALCGHLTFKSWQFIPSQRINTLNKVTLFFCTSFWSLPSSNRLWMHWKQRERDGNIPAGLVVCTTLKGMLLRITVKEGRKCVFNLGCSELWETLTFRDWDNSVSGHKVAD